MPTTFAVPDGRVAMAATLYTGNATAGTTISNAVNAVGMQPDFVWIKNRTGANNHILTDSVRGVTKTLFSDATSAEATVAGGLTAFNSGGFQIGYDGSAIVNATSNNYVGWQWNAGGTTVTNGTGTISSQVRANTTAGFSVVTWTGTGTGATSVGHGLPVLPQLVFVKKRNVAENWYVGAYANQGLNYAYHLFLNTTGANSGNNDPYVLGAQTSLTSNVLQLADGVSGNGGNQTGTNYVAYCWAPVAGYSAFGSYTGNGSTDGPFVYTGFRPRFVMIKSSTYTSNWDMLDSSRDPANVVSHQLFANLSGTEFTPYNFGDLNSNGFKIRDNSSGLQGNYNVSGETYIYAAFAENPLKYANAR